MSDSPQYLSELGAALAGAGVRGARRDRILAEFADHLACDPEADLGDAGSLASQFADELGTSFARSAAFRAFVALALAGLVVGVRLLAILPLRVADFQTGETVALLVAALAGQVALVAGGLGLLRALQLRGSEVIPGAEAVVLARRAGVGLASGAVTTLAISSTQHASARTGATA